MLRDIYSMIINCDSADYKWCSRKGRYCHKDDYGFECSNCRR